MHRDSKESKDLHNLVICNKSIYEHKIQRFMMRHYFTYNEVLALRETKRQNVKIFDFKKLDTENQLQLCAKTSNSQYYCCLIISFKKSIKAYYILPNGMKELIFGHPFNQILEPDVFPQTLTILSFCKAYNQKFKIGDL